MCASETLDISPKPSSTLKLRGCNSYLRSQLQRSLNDALSSSIEDVVGSSLYRVSLFFYLFLSIETIDLAKVRFVQYI